MLRPTSRAFRRRALFAVWLVSTMGWAPTEDAAAQTCPDYVPTECQEIAPTFDLPRRIDRCYVVKSGGSTPYVHEWLNVVEGGALYFVEDPGRDIDFQVQALLVEKGGVVQAGSPECPFGVDGGTLQLGLYGDDPTDQGTKAPAGSGIECLTNPDADSRFRCFPPGRDYEQGYYCTTPDSDDPCSSTTPPADEPGNSQLHGYGRLNFDTNSFGYKTLAIAYGGSLRLFGAKGAKPLQDRAWAQDFDSEDHCVVPTPSDSNLDAAEMRSWANLSGSSWARLDAMSDESGKTLLTLDRELTGWQVGDQIVVGTTDWYPSHSELRTIESVATTTGPSGTATQVEVAMLDYPHFTEIFDTEALEAGHGASFTHPVNRKAVDSRAVVGLLSRSITVRSLGDEPRRAEGDPGFPTALECLADRTKPECYFGGHVIVRQGFRDFRLQGVEFKQLGQGGRIGHYPVHFHLAKSASYTEGKAFIKDSSIWDSMTRFVTVHGTHDVTVARNVGYLSLGHGFYIEDGSEIENRLCHNLGVSARAALEQYFEAQANPERWGECHPPPEARYLPPILDGSAANPSPGAPAALRVGSDTYMPTMYWMMNAYNEFVGNAAVGVHGFGSCFWLLGSGVSGPSQFLGFEGLANYNRAGAYQAPLLRFRGNSCTTAPLALPASAELSPSAIGEAQNTGFDAVQNPYLTNGAPLAGNFDRPVVVGNFQPIQPDAGSQTCVDTNSDPKQLETNTKACVTTVIDRFATSFNWAEVNYGSIWLRPWFYLFANSAITDQLFGGLTFVTGGSWLQVPPGYFSLAKNNLMVGVTQHGGSPWAKRSGPVFEVTPSSSLTSYAPCANPNTCNFAEEGTGYWKGSFQPKRLINIYDGPHFAGGNTFLNVGSWECDPQPCAGKAPGTCNLELPCGIYSGSTQPRSEANPDHMVVIDAAVGWKQPNGFYYPPAFTYRRNAFLKTLPTGLPDDDPTGPLNQCYAAEPDQNPEDLKELPGSCRHNVIDRTRDYVQGNMLALNAADPTFFTAAGNTLPVSTIDFSTVLIDVDASLTGATGKVDGVSGAVPTTSVSRNEFFDAPSQSPECLAFGVQTTPYKAVTSVVAPLAASAASADTSIDSSVWRPTPMVAIYRQWRLANDSEACGSVCSDADPTKYGCTRATFMGGSSIGQASYLTLTEPPGLSEAQPGALYYIDTNSGAQSLDCIRARTGDMAPAPFEPSGNYVLYNLFPQPDARSSYQVYVGDAATLEDVQGRFVRVTPHETAGNAFASRVLDACDPRSPGQWCSDMPTPRFDDGVMTVILDHAPLASAFEIAQREDYERCIPRDLCYFDQGSGRCERCTKGEPSCIRQDDFLEIDIASMNQPDATGDRPLDVVCQDWASFASGTVADEPQPLSLADCPADGCLGFAFQLPANFSPRAYADVSPSKALSHCFLESAWMDDALLASGDDPLCGEPRTQRSSDFCQDPMLTLPSTKDSFVAPMSPGQNAGAGDTLLIGGASGHRSLVGFEQDEIDGFLASQDLSRAWLVLTLAEPTSAAALVDAHPLATDFVEGEELYAARRSSQAARLGGVGARRPSRGLAGRVPVRSSGAAGGDVDPGVTWTCAADANPRNEQATDCAIPWRTPGGDFDEASAPPVAPSGNTGTKVVWDVTDDVLDGALAWVLRARDERGAPIAVFSRESANDLESAGEPMLILE